MQTIRPVNKRIVVKKADKVRKVADGSPFSSLPTNDNLGEVLFSDDERCPVGTRVYYSGKIDRFTLQGTEVHAMDFDNIIAILEDADDSEKEANG